MPNDFVGVSIEGLPQLRAKFAKLPGLVCDEGVDEANKYLVNVMRAYSPYRYVTRKSAYGVTFFSEKQRRLVMAKIREGSITPGTPRRTQALSGGWKIIGSGVKSIVTNEVAHGPFVQGESKTQQSRHAKKEGWKGIDVVVKDRMSEIIRKFEAGAKKAIRILGL